MTLRERIFGKKPAITAEHSKGLFTHESSDKGKVVTLTQLNDEAPHPANMSNYEDWCRDPDTDTALDLLSDMVTGPQPYLQMPEEDENGNKIDPKHPNLKKCMQWLKRSKFRTQYHEIQRTKMGKGFCPIELLSGDRLKILPPETIFIVRNDKGTVIGYRQRINQAIVAEWQPDEIVVFARNQSLQHPYGIAIVDSIGTLIDTRKDLNDDIAKIIHRFSAPRGIHECDKDIEPFKTAMKGADVDEDIYLSNVSKDTLRHTFLEPDPRIKFEGYITRVDIQIDQRLHAPLILLLKSATEASAGKMLESVDRTVQSEQERNAEVIEERFFKPLCGDGPTPEFLHGLPNTKLEKVTFGEIGILQANQTLTWKQAQDLLRQKGIRLIEDKQPEKPLAPAKPQWTPEQPTQKPKAELEMLVEHLNDVDTALNIITENFEQHKITLVEACRLGGETIAVHMKQAYPETWETEREKKFTVFTKGLVRLKNE